MEMVSTGTESRCRSTSMPGQKGCPGSLAHTTLDSRRLRSTMPATEKVRSPLPPGLEAPEPVPGPPVVAAAAAPAAAAAAAALVGLASSPGAAFAAAASTLDSVIELTPANFAAEVEAPGAGRVFVEFYAPWCPFCQRLEPVWSELPSKLAAAQVSTKVARMNVDTYTKYGETYGITGFPTLMLFQDGRPVGQKTGLIDMSTAMRYAGVKDAGLLASAASAPPPPQMNLVLTGPQVDRAMEELSALRRDVEATLPEGAEARGSALERIKKVELLFASRSL
mmetsp:Transcript_35029/g.85851  ORF Transcript_35029/g.85851 Transcript_35029/m.85851 type:complete len:280 (-) Transcript_35029:119-958(-)